MNKFTLEFFLSGMSIFKGYLMPKPSLSKNGGGTI